MSQPVTPPAFCLRNVTLKREKKALFRDLDLLVNPGEKVVLLGRSGIGKSSLLQLFLGFVMAANGSVSVAGQDTIPQLIGNIRQQISFIPQELNIGTGKVGQLINEYFSFKANEKGRPQPHEIEHWLEYLELQQDILEKYVYDLSGGERQRIAIMIALLLKRKLYLLDEVTAALDKHLKKKVADLFCQQADWTVLSISHDHAWLEHPEVRVYQLES